MEAVERLPQPYRYTILLRYFEGITTEEIAKRAGLTTSAVRSRLQRGLSQLRRDLDAEYGDREQWHSALAVLCQPLGQTVGIAASAATGASTVVGTNWIATGGWAIAMKKFMSAAAIAAIMLLGYWYYDSRSNDTTDPGGSNATMTPTVTDGDTTPTPPPPPLDDIPSSTSPPTAVVTADDTAEATESTEVGESGAEGPPAVIKGRIWRTDDVSLEGSRVVIYRKGRPGSVIDAEGFFEFETHLSAGVSLYLEHDGFTLSLDTEVRPIAGEEVVVEIEVDPGHELVVEVIDKVTRQPVADINMAVRRATHRGQATMVVKRTDEDGFFRCEFLPEADYVLDIDRPEYVTVNDRFSVPEQNRILVELVPAPMINVVLENYELYPAQEKVFFSLFQMGTAGFSTVSASLSGKPDETGRFQSKSPGGGTWRYDLMAYGGFPRVGGQVTIPETTDAANPPTLTVTLPKPGDVTIIGTLVDEGGTPISSGTIQIGQNKGNVDANGRFKIEQIKVGKHRPRWVRGDGNDRVERSLDSIDVPDQDRYEVTCTVLGTGSVTSWIEGLPQEMLAGIAAFSLERVDGGTPKSPSYGVTGAHQRLTLDHIPHGRYRISPSFGHMSISTLPGKEIDIGEFPVDVTFRYRAPAKWTITYEFPEDATAPPSVVAKVEQDGKYIDREYMALDGGQGTFESYLEGEYTFIFQANGFKNVVHTLTIEPESEETLTVRFEAKP